MLRTEKASSASCPRSYRLIFGSHRSIASPSGFSKGNLGLYVGKSMCNENHRFNKKIPVVAIAVGKLWSIYLSVTGSNHWTVIGFSLTVNFDELSQLLRSQSKQSGLVCRPFIKAVVCRSWCCFPRLRPPCYKESDKPHLAIIISFRRAESTVRGDIPLTSNFFLAMFQLLYRVLFTFFNLQHTLYIHCYHYH